MGALAGIGSAQVTIKTPTLDPGQYKIQVVSGGVKLFRSPANGTDFFIVNAKIVESDNPAHPVGALRGWVCKITGNLSALGNIKGFMAAGIGIDATTAKPEALDVITESAIEQVIANDLFKGLVLNLRVHQVTTRKGDPFNVHTFSPLAAEG